MISKCLRFTLQRTSEHEFKALRLQVSELQKKLEDVKRDLAATQSILATKDNELEALQKNLKELVELRELKEVFSNLLLDLYLFSNDDIYLPFFWFLDRAILFAYLHLIGD